MATKTYKPKRKISATESEEIKIPASSVDGLSTVATSGSYNDLSNKPTIPTKTSQLTNNSGYITSDGAVKSVIDYNDTSKNIKIGYSGAGITGDNIKYIAGYTVSDGTAGNVARIKDISKDALKSWLGYATVATSGSYNDLSNKPTIPDVSGLMPKSGGTFTGEVKFGSTENFQGYYIKRMLGSLGIGTAYNSLDSKYKDGTYHRMWRLRFPSGSSFWGKIKVTLYGNYSSFNASGVMSKSITCNFNTSNIYNNVGCYDGLGVNVEQDFRISEAIWNATASAWEVLIWQKNLNGNNSPTIMLECWTTNNTNYINAFNGIAAQAVELTQMASYSAQKASPTGGTKTVEWATLPVYENPLGEEIATAGDLSNKANLSGGNTFSGEQFIENGSIGDKMGFCAFNYTDPNHPELTVSDSARVCLDNGYGTAGQVFTSQGENAPPIWTTPSGGATDAVKYTAQTLTASQKSQARSNIGAGTGNGTVTGVKINGSTKSPDSAGLVDLGTISGGGSSNVIVDRPMIQGVEYTVFDSGEYGSFIGTFSLETQDSSITITVGNADYIITNNDWVHCKITIDKNNEFVYSTIAINTGNVNRTWFFSTLPSNGIVKISTDLTSSYSEHNVCVIMKGVI